MKALRFLFPALLACTALVARAEQTAFFENKIRPVLVESCYKCHSAKSPKLKGGLALDTKEGTVLGGESGKPGITAHKPSASSVYVAMTWADEDMQMPPKKKLSADVIADFKKWIEMGASDPREATGTVAANAPKKRQIDMDEGRKHWAFQPVKDIPAPAVKDTAWPRNDIDKHLLASMEAAGLKPMPDADRATLIRRIAFDLTGLPPTPDEVKAFLADTSPDAVKRIIDGYLDSPRFGERWGRHWLDVARYAESAGKEVAVLYPHAWRYRDYVIAAFNKDMPYDQFIKEQLAGDLMRSENKRDQAEKIVATGFLAIGAKNHAERDRRQFNMDITDEQIDVMSQSMLGLTIACARCHDHKFDPIGQRDYYALAGIFLSSDTLYGSHVQLQNNHPSDLIELDREAGQIASLGKISPTEVAMLKRKAEAQETEATQIRAEAMAAMRSNNNKAIDAIRLRQQRSNAENAKADVGLFYDDGAPRPLAMGVLDKTFPTDTPLLVRGEINQPSDVVPRGLVEVLLPKGEPLNIGQGSGRLDLAWFIASRDNPLTARVMANRIWLHLFGKGIVATPDNFGVKGMAPSNPALLDHLATRFIDNGWSVKRTIKEIMLSRAYQMSSNPSAANEAADPDNNHFWRMNKRRLEAEAIRDSMLSVSGLLNLYPIDGSPVARVADGREGLFALSREIAQPSEQCRSVYLPVIRDQIQESLNLFDFPDASLVTGDRDATNVSSQSLYLMNSPQAQGIAKAFARRLGSYEGSGPDKLARAFSLCFARSPTPDEASAIRSFFMTFTSKFAKGKTLTAEATKQASNAAMTAFCQALMASAEFRYLN